MRRGAGHHLNGAASQTKAHGPQRVGLAPGEELVHGGGEHLQATNEIGGLDERDGVLAKLHLGAAPGLVAQRNLVETEVVPVFSALIGGVRHGVLLLGPLRGLLIVPTRVVGIDQDFRHAKIRPYSRLHRSGGTP